ncbi:MAG TPA: GNAT family N-acetyltransferase [Polyangiaceae bacterium]|jgi:phosphinothricin acetyltransferase
MILREATEDDLDGILTIFNQVIATSTAVWIDDPTTKEERHRWMTGLFSKGYPIFVATDAHGVAGYGSFGEFRGRPGYRFTVEHSIHVRDGVRRSGVGRALLETLIARAAETGKHAMIGGIDAENSASLAFHARFGFREVGRLPQVGAKFGRWIDLVFMQRMIGAADRPAT